MKEKELLDFTLYHCHIIIWFEGWKLSISIHGVNIGLFESLEECVTEMNNTMGVGKFRHAVSS